MRQRDWDLENGTLPEGLGIGVDGPDGVAKLVTLRRTTTVGIGPDAAMWLYYNEDKTIRVAFIHKFTEGAPGKPDAEMRALGIVSRHGQVPMDVGVALSETFLPGEATEMAYLQWRHGWPPALLIRNTPRLFTPFPIVPNRN